MATDAREFDTRAGTLEVAIPKLRSGSYFPEWLLERRRRAERALTTVVATCYLLGVSTRADGEARRDPGHHAPVEVAGVDEWPPSSTPRSQTSGPGRSMPGRTRSSPPTPWCSRSARAAARERPSPLVATGVNADGHREILGLQVTSSEDGASWLAFFRDLTARGLSGVRLVTSDAHRGLVDAIGATLPSASWQRCSTHYAANLMAATPKASWPWVRALLHSVYDQPDAASVHAQFDRVLDALTEKLPKVAEHLEQARLRRTRVHRVPQRGLARDLEQQPQRTAQREIRRRTDVVGIFPDRDAIVRLVGAVLAEQHDEWAEGRRYLGLDVLSRARLTPVPTPTATEEVTPNPDLPALSA